MSQDLRIPRAFLRKILQKLNSSGILISTKGKGGGFVLAVPPEKIRLSDIITIFQGTVQISDCLFKKRPCPDVKNCRLCEKINTIRAMVDRELGSTTLDTLIYEER